MSEQAKCQLCGKPMPEGEEMFNYHGYSGPCPDVVDSQQTQVREDSRSGDKNSVRAHPVSEEAYKLPVYRRTRIAFIVSGFGFSIWSGPFSIVLHWRNREGNVWSAKAIVGYVPDEEKVWWRAGAAAKV